MWKMYKNIKQRLYLLMNEPHKIFKLNIDGLYTTSILSNKEILLIYTVRLFLYVNKCILSI